MGRTMRGKAMLLIASGAAVAVGLLVVRQQRLQAVYEMTRALERAAEDDRSLWIVRAEIARAIRPEEVAAMASRLGPMAPILREVAPAEGEPTLVPPRARPGRELSRAERSGQH
jgi:hypothetical protein